MFSLSHVPIYDYLVQARSNICNMQRHLCNNTNLVDHLCLQTIIFWLNPRFYITLSCSDHYFHQENEFLCHKLVIFGLILQIYHKTTKLINQHLRGCKTYEILLNFSRLTQNHRFYITLSFTDHDFQFLCQKLAFLGLFWRFRPKQQKCPSWKKL